MIVFTHVIGGTTGCSCTSLFSLAIAEYQRVVKYDSWVAFFFFFFSFFFYSKPRPFRRNSTIEQQCEQWAARILKAALGNVAAGSIQLRRPEVSASTQERRAMYGGGGGGESMKGG